MGNKVTFYVDPQSYGNLARYDYNLLSNMTGKIFFIGSKLYDFRPLDKIQRKMIFSYSKYKNPILKTISYLCSLLLLFLLICKHRPSCVHIQWFKIPSLDYHYYKLLKSLFHLRIIHTAHNVLPHNTGERYAEIYNKLYHLADIVIVHTENTKKEIAKKFLLDREKLCVIRHGLLHLDYDKEEYLRVEEEMKQKYQLNGKFIFVSLGEQSHYKGFDIITKAWLLTPELRENEKITLVLAGTIVKEDISEISQCSNVIIQNRFISEEEFIFWLHQADVYLLLYREISQSGAMLTALSEHVPVLVSDHEGLTEPLSVASVGWKLKELSPEYLSTKMKELIDSRDIVQAVKADIESWKKIEKYFSWESISKSTQELYSVSAS